MLTSLYSILSPNWSYQGVLFTSGIIFTDSNNYGGSLLPHLEDENGNELGIIPLHSSSL
jgi:hypothetical protein